MIVLHSIYSSASISCFLYSLVRATDHHSLCFWHVRGDLQSQGWTQESQNENLWEKAISELKNTPVRAWHSINSKHRSDILFGTNKYIFDRHFCWLATTWRPIHCFAFMCDASPLVCCEAVIWPLLRVQVIGKSKTKKRRRLWTGQKRSKTPLWKFTDCPASTDIEARSGHCKDFASMPEEGIFNLRLCDLAAVSCSSLSPVAGILVLLIILRLGEHVSCMQRVWMISDFINNFAAIQW